jgi:hypothetical protein
VYRAAAGLLVALGALTGVRTPLVWFKICPEVLAGGAGLLLAASWLQRSCAGGLRRQRQVVMAGPGRG